jgi:hypothetical protein
VVFKSLTDGQRKVFVFLERAGAQLMLCQRQGRYETGTLDHPLGRGAMFQIYVESLEPILNALNLPLYEPLSDRWYRVGDREKGLRQFLVQDPDRYLILFGQSLGKRTIE